MRFLNLVRTLRTQRTLPSIMLILLAVAIQKKIQAEIFILLSSMILIYSSASIHNHIKDQELKSKKYNKIITLIPIFLAILISSTNKITLIATFSWIILGLSYNTISRKVLLADTTLLSITHYFIPLTFSLIILEQTIFQATKTGLLISLIFWFVLPIKNLKGTDKDKKLDYKTLPTIINKGEKITIIASLFFIILFSILQFFLNVNIILIIITILLYISAIKTKNNIKTSLKLFRLLFIFSIFTLITTTQNHLIIVISAIIPITFSTKILTKKWTD